MIDYNKELIERAKRLRKEMTPWEGELWHKFLKVYPAKIYRQRVIENFIADFYCSKARVVIELDGGGHYQKAQLEYDKHRTEALEAKGYKVIRFTNFDVDKNFEGVCYVIDKVIKERMKLLGVTPQSPAE